MSDPKPDATPAHQRAATQAAGAAGPADMAQTLLLGPSTARATASSGEAGRSPAFDDHHPPDPDLLNDCVHCGFCLPTCPTYLLWGEEMDSPRGRIYLMSEAEQGEPLNASMVKHLDQCLGCMACVTACPSGVQYDKLIEATRQQVDRRFERPTRDRLLRRALFALFPYSGRLRLVAGPLRCYQRSGLQHLVRRTGLIDRLPAPIATMERLAPVLPKRTRIPERTAALGRRRAVVGMLTGCVQSVFFPGVNDATVRVLAAEGCDVIAPARQGCCGALSIHIGREAEALDFARHTIDVFERAGVDAVVVNAAGCGSTMKEYAYLLRDDPAYADRAAVLAAKVRDVAEILVELGPVAPRHPLPITLAYHDACHLAHAQGIRAQPRALLRAIPGVELREITEAEICCGSAGVYNILQPEPATELGSRKARNILATGAELLVTANPGCLMQVAQALDRTGETLAMAHTVEVLDASIRGLPAESLTALSRRYSHPR